ncbi:acyl carrier protein [Pseudooceanicola sp. CBS1P-1]|uniref:Acyl carrier protein n=1 Tax=Pseudooceanicola albus TaxID=2692189 RepID=A0A6L7G8K1_9RHOB|nr:MULTISPECIES: acyl carrier protein [Pseudooceanicola]MBT9386229.1 acyl carrier protein [Pseudooceanicola endophyticus]MXN20279.1 acyl carrier protein [Pseudooceanicola albus]
MNETISAAIRDALSEVTERPAAALTAETRFDRDYDLDSYMFVQFLLTLEDKLPGLRFAPEDIGQADFNTAGTLATHVEAALIRAGARADA